MFLLGEPLMFLRPNEAFFPCFIRQGLATRIRGGVEMGGACVNSVV